MQSWLSEVAPHTLCKNCFKNCIGTLQGLSTFIIIINITIILFENWNLPRKEILRKKSCNPSVQFVKYICYWIIFKLRKYLRESGRRIDERKGRNWECSNWKTQCGIWFDIEGKLTKILARKQEKHRGQKSWKSSFLSWRHFFFYMKYIEYFSAEELKEAKDNLTKIFVHRWSQHMLITQNLMCSGYPIELAPNLTLNRLWVIPLDKSDQLLLISHPNFITSCKFKPDLKSGTKAYD